MNNNDAAGYNKPISNFLLFLYLYNCWAFLWSTVSFCDVQNMERKAKKNKYLQYEWINLFPQSLNSKIKHIKAQLMAKTFWTRPQWDLEIELVFWTGVLLRSSVKV